MARSRITIGPADKDEIIGGDVAAVERVANSILAHLKRRQIDILEGRTHVGGTTEERRILVWLVVQCWVNDLLLPRPLVGALSLALDPSRAQTLESAQWLSSRLTKREALTEFERLNPSAGVNEAARAVDVEPSTVSRRRRRTS